MPHPDPDRDDRPQAGHPGGADSSYPQRRTPRHTRRAAEEPVTATADLWPGYEEPQRARGAAWSGPVDEPWPRQGADGGPGAGRRAGHRDDPWSDPDTWSNGAGIRPGQGGDAGPAGAGWPDARGDVLPGRGGDLPGRGGDLPGRGRDAWPVPDDDVTPGAGRSSRRRGAARQQAGMDDWSTPGRGGGHGPDRDSWRDPADDRWSGGSDDDWHDPERTELLPAVTDDPDTGHTLGALPPGPVAAEPGEPEAAAGGAVAGRRSRAGRNLPAAIGVGVGLGAVVLASLFLWPPAFVAVAALAAGVGCWEMVRAAQGGGLRAPLPPVLAGGTVTIGLAWFGGPEVLPLGLLVTVVAILVWRLGDGAAGYQRDVTVAIMIAAYVPFLASFAVLLVRPEDGALRVLAALIGVVLSDTGGYAAGVFLGRHPMAPKVSPKKSWEGFAGSVLSTAAGEAVLLHLLFDVAWWQGAVFGTAVSMAAVLGDLAESLIKRDLNVKDMSSLLPGHGGLMDRLDSILLAAPVAYALLALFAPAAS